MNCLTLVVVLLLTDCAYAKPHEPVVYSCLKRDGDWLDGVNRKQCRLLGGEWRVQR